MAYQRQLNCMQQPIFLIYPCMALALPTMEVDQMVKNIHSHHSPLPSLDPSLLLPPRRLASKPTLESPPIMSIAVLSLMVMMLLNFSSMDKSSMFMEMSMLLVKNGTIWMDGVIDMMPLLQIMAYSIFVIGR